MIKTLSIATMFMISACGGGEYEDIHNLPSTQPAVPCEKSVECMTRTAANDDIKSCDEKYHGGTMMSTWDNGRSWLVGNCDSTAE